MANAIPPIPGIEVHQLRTAGWTVTGGNPATKVAYSKTLRTPAPRFPRHRFRSTWGYKDDEWKILEAVNIDELEGIYGELPERMIASITLFLALPEDEEEAKPTAMSSPSRYQSPKGTRLP